MPIRKDITGCKYGHLTGVSYVTSNKQRASVWLFRCDCGNEKELDSRPVTAGRIRTCGSCEIYHKLKSGAGTRGQSHLASHNRLYQQAMRVAKKEGSAWSLSLSEFMELSTAECTLCGASPSTQLRGTRLRYNKIQPVSIKGPYTQTNCCTICKDCSSVFHKTGISQLIERVATVYGHITRHPAK